MSDKDEAATRGWTRRQVAKLGAAAGAAASLPLLHFRAVAQSAATAPVPGPRFTSWDDLYRQQWTWDRVAKGTHAWMNCRSACEFDLYIKDGVVVREEQSATYRASEPGVPDFNPRGCQKGACYTEMMYGPSRLTVPLKRVGPRGSGQWQQVSWDEALDEIATAILDTIEAEGTDAIVHDLGPHFDEGPTTLGRARFFAMLGAAMLDSWAEIGDLNHGATLTFGFPHVGGSADEWFLSDFLVVWMMNPSVTQIPDAHFLFEARYRGAELVVIAPEYSATAIHADAWLPIAPGTDAALALATARHIWASGRIELDYVREQTDLPLLVRLDTGRLLRQSDMAVDGRDDCFYFWDPEAAAPRLAPATLGSTEASLELDGFAPPIEGRFQAILADGQTVDVAPVGALIKEQLDPWTFARAAAVTGMHAEQIERFAEGFARAERPMVLSSWGSNRYFHSDLMNRAKILCLALKGAIGKRGAGFHSTGWVSIEGFEAGLGMRRSGWLGLVGAALEPEVMIRDLPALILRRKSLLELANENLHDRMDRETCATNNASLNYTHQGIAGDLSVEQDDLYPRPLSSYERESGEQNWVPVHPRRTIRPRVWVTGGNNLLRRTNLPQRMLEHLWPELRLMVDVNIKLTSTGMHADLLLPAASAYEKPNIKYPVAYIPYLHYGDAAVPPLGESKDEWEIFHLLAQKVAAGARARGLAPVNICGDKAHTVDLQSFDELYSFGGAFGPKDAEGVAQQILDVSVSKLSHGLQWVGLSPKPATSGMRVRDLKRTGIARYTGTGLTTEQSQLYNMDWDGEGILQALTHFVQDKWRWPTLSGRQQFYIDHPWYVEAGEALPTHKPSPQAGGNGRFQFVSCHSRWSVHSVWRDTPMLLRLQRGEPVVYLNPTEAAELGVADGAWAELSNRYGRMRMRCKHATMVRPGVAYYFHAWEPFQFPEHHSYKRLIPGLIKPLHFAGGYGHVRWGFAMWEPGMQVQDTRVDIRPWKEPTDD